MDVREDLPKISVETEQDWRRLQRNISTAFLDRLDLELESQGVSQDRESFLPHINQVRGASFVRTRHSEIC
jgi:predicted ATPase with chaperone activity